MYIRKYIIYKKARIAYFTSGSGDKSVIFCHGDAQNHGVGIPYLNLFPENYKKIAVDLPGHGDSSDFELRTLQTESDVLNKIIKKECSSAPILIGHSHGGALVSHYSVNNKTSSLILIDPFFTDPRKIFGSWKLSLFEKLYLLGAYGKYNPQHGSRIFEDEKTDKEISKASLINTPYATLKKNLGLYDNYDVIEQMKEHNIPIFIIQSGKQSVCSAKEHVLNVVKAMKNSKLKIIENGTHNMHILMKRAVSDEIKNQFEFLNVL